jgi:hypothetical protein
MKDRLNDFGDDKPDYSPERYSTVLKSADMESIESLHERHTEISVVSNEFLEGKNMSHISFDESLSNFSISVNSLKKLKKKGDNSCYTNNNILSNENSNIKNKNNRKKGHNKIKFEQKKTQNNKQLINSQKSFKNIIQNYLRKDSKQSKSGNKQIFHKIQPYKINLKDAYNTANRDKIKNSNYKAEENKNKTPQLSSHTPLSFKTNLRSSMQTNLTSRNNIISPTTFLKVNLTKESLADKTRKGGLLLKENTKGNLNDYSSNKELVSSNIFKTIISNLVTPNKKLPNKCVKPPVTSKANLSLKKEEQMFLKKTNNNILGINNTNNTTSFNNSKTSSVYNINLNLNLNVNFNNSSKGSSSNTTMKNHNNLNSNNSQTKPRINDINNVISLKENKINIYESHIIKKINSPRREECNTKELSTKIESNELPLTDRLKSPKESILKQSNEKTTNVNNTLEQGHSKGKNLNTQKNNEASSKERKSNVRFINKILPIKTTLKKSQNKLKEQVIKSITPICTNNSLNKLFKLNLDLKIFDTKNSQEPKKVDSKQKYEEIKKTSTSNQAKKMTENMTSSQGIKIKNFDKILDMKKYLTNNTNTNNLKSNSRLGENKQKVQIKLDKKK